MEGQERIRGSSEQSTLPTEKVFPPQNGSEQETELPPDDLSQSSEDSPELTGSGDERHKVVGKLMSDLARTARSFAFYDPFNQAIHQFIVGLINDFERTITKYGAITVAIQPFELWYDGEAVYVNRDHERSLAFRLYRDGVRTFSFEGDFPLAEMAKFLEILSLRFTGAHQTEEDTVTLLWRANFTHMTMTAVEGFIPEEELGENGTISHIQTHGDGSAEKLTDNVDLPVPHLPPAVQLTWPQLAPEAIECLQAEAHSHHTAFECVHLVSRVSQTLDDPIEEMKLSELQHILSEISSFLQSEDNLPFYLKFLDILDELKAEKAPDWDPSRNAIAEQIWLHSTESRALIRIFRSVRRGVSQKIITLLDRLSDKPLPLAVDILRAEKSASSRQLAQELFSHYGKDNLEVLLHQFPATPPLLACDLLHAVAKMEGPLVVNFIADQVTNLDSQIRDTAIELIGNFPYSGSVGRALAVAFKRASPDTRIKVLALMAKTHDSRFIDLICKYIDENANTIMDKEAISMGTTMGQLDSGEHLEDWFTNLKPKGFLKKHLPGTKARNIAMAAAIAEVPGERSLKALRKALHVAEADIQKSIGLSLARNSAIKAR